MTVVVQPDPRMTGARRILLRNSAAMRRWLALAPALVLGCASASQPSLLGSSAPQGDQYCRVAWAPDPLPPVSAVLDSAELAAALTREVAAPGGHALISLAADSSGTWTRTSLIESTLGSQVDDRLAGMVRQHLRPADARRQMRLRLAFSDQWRFELGATQSCSSALLNAAEIEGLLKAAAADLRVRGVVVLRIQTRVTGCPGEIVVTRSSGNTALGAAAVRTGERMIFHPALNDGIPVEVWSEIPLTFR